MNKNCLGKVVVTGAGGFIGSHLVERLLASGNEVRAFLHYNSRHDVGLLKHVDSSALQKVEIVSGDLKDYHAVLNVVKGADVVMHLGALIGIPYSYRNPKDVVETNVMGTLNVLMAANEVGVKRMVHTSTSEVYGTACTQKIKENHPLQAQSPYSASKIGADKIVESFVASYKTPVVTLRPFNTFGPRQSMRAIIPTIIAQTLFQDEIVLGSLEPTRDFTYVQDTADGFISAAGAKGVEGKTFNLGTDREVSVQELVRFVSEITGIQKPVRSVQERKRPEASEVMRLHSDFQSAKQVLGWQSEVSLEEGLARTIGWIKDHARDYSATHYVI